MEPEINNSDIDEDEDIEEIIEPNTYIDDEYMYMEDYNEEEKEYYMNAWNKEYKNEELCPNVIIKTKKKI